MKMRHVLLPGGAPLLALVMAGCASLQSGAPQVDPAMIRIAAGDGVSAETLTGGRRLLAMRCTNCHALEPVAKYSPSEWEANVRSMADRAGLSESETLQITAYLVAARESAK